MRDHTPILPLAGLLAATILLGGCEVRQGAPSPGRGPERPEPVLAAPARSDAVEKAPEPETHEGDLKAYIVRAQASSVQVPRHAAELAFDGDRKTRWSSDFKDGEWLEGIFDRPVLIREITLHWETARASDFAVSVLNARTNWVQVARATHAQGERDRLTLPAPALSLAVRIDCLRRATEWGSSIMEVDVVGEAVGLPPAENLLGYRVPATEGERRERGISERLLAGAAADPPTSAGLSDEAFLDLVARRSFDYFWWETHPETGLTRDRGRHFGSSEEVSIASVAAVGFALTAYAVGADRHWVDRDEALARVRLTLRTFADGPVRNVRGFFPHFVDMFTGEESPHTEISTIDTALFLAGMITAMEYFQDAEVTSQGRRIFERVDWPWARNGHPHFLSHGLDERGRFLASRWGSTTEGLLIYLLALGSPTYPLSAEAWYALDRTVGEHHGYRFVVESGFQSMFRYQYPALWYDFRGRTDRAGIDYFDNATRAALTMRQYCIDQGARFPRSYGPDLWGLSAADGPGDGYMIYGFPPGQPYSPTDGTVVPYAVAGSTPFIPRHALRALRRLYDEHHDAWGKYGFADSLNPTVDYIARDAIGLDAGTILLGIENYRTGFVWRYFMRNEWIRNATETLGWQLRPRSVDPGGPVDLMRTGRWRLRRGGDPPSAPGVEVVVPDRSENAGPAFRDVDGEVLYQVEFALEAERLQRWVRSGRAAVLTLGAIDDADETFVNGTKVGETRAGPESYRQVRRYPVPWTVLKAGRNTVSVKVVDLGGAGGIWDLPVEIGPR